MSFSVKPVPKNSNIIFIIVLVVFALISSSAAWAGKAIVVNKSSHDISITYALSPVFYAPNSMGFYGLDVKAGRTGVRDYFADWTRHLIDKVVVAFIDNQSVHICEESVPTGKKYYHTKVIATDSGTNSFKCDISFW